MKPVIQRSCLFVLCVLTVSPVYSRVINPANILQPKAEGTNVVNTTLAVTPTPVQLAKTQTTVSTPINKSTEVTTHATLASSLSTTPAGANRSSAKATEETPRPVSNVVAPSNTRTSSIKLITISGSVTPTQPVITGSPPSTVAIKQKSIESQSVTETNSSNTTGVVIKSNSGNNVSSNGSSVSNQSSTPPPAVESTIELNTTAEVTTESAVEVTEPPVTEEVEVEETEPPTVTEGAEGQNVTEAPEFEETEPVQVTEVQVTEVPEVEETEPPTPGEGGAEGSQPQGTVSTEQSGILIKAEAQQAIADQNAKGHASARSVNPVENGLGSEAAEAAEVEEPA